MIQHLSFEIPNRGYWAFVGEHMINNVLTHHFSHEAYDFPEMPEELRKGELLASVRYFNAWNEYRRFRSGYLDLGFHLKGNLTVKGFFSDAGAATEAFAEVCKLLPERDPGADLVPVSFWSWSEQHGPTRSVRQIRTPLWTEVEANYPGSLRGKLDETINLGSVEHDSASGRVLLWRGDPGTGKTWALRALLRAWKPWCAAHYIVDPDVFFSRAEYLTGVIGQLCVSNNDNVVAAARWGVPVDASAPRSKDRNWNLLILEDTGELIAVDAKARTGQALSKLLNLGDGLLGQGLNLLTLITTNDEINALHPAITREGRCLSNLSFRAFEPTEVHDWLTAKSLKIPKLEKKSLAELFALVRESGTIKNQAERSRAGFLNG